MRRFGQHLQGLRRGRAQHFADFPATLRLNDDLLTAFVKPIRRLRSEIAQKAHEAMPQNEGCHDRHSKGRRRFLEAACGSELAWRHSRPQAASRAKAYRGLVRPTAAIGTALKSCAVGHSGSIANASHCGSSSWHVFAPRLLIDRRSAGHAPWAPDARSPLAGPPDRQPPRRAGPGDAGHASTGRR